MINNDITFYAFRYAIGRQTYAVNDVANYLYQHWSELDKQTQDLIIKETKDYLYMQENKLSDINIIWQRLINMVGIEDAGTKDFSL